MAVNPVLVIALAALVLCASMVCLQEVGRRVGVRRLHADLTGSNAGVGAVNAAVLSLLGLVLAFGYADASKRLYERRQLAVQETNDIGTAWLRVALLPPATQPAIRESFRRCVDARIDAYRDQPTDQAALESLAKVDRAQTELWNLAVDACAKPEGERARILLFPALNAMFDIGTTRLAMRQMHPPGLVCFVFTLIALASAFLAGMSMAPAKARSWIHIIGFAILVSATVYLIAELEFPRHGIVRNDWFDQMLVVLRDQLR